MARLNAIVRSRSDLRAQEVGLMYELYAAYYAATCPQRFREDLAGKDLVIELREGAALRGFSTIALMRFGEREERRAIFSGDTIIDHRYWGEQGLAQAFCRLAGRIKAQSQGAPLHWFLISKGHRTYRYLSAFAREYYPSHRAPTPAREQTWLDELATRRFGVAYLPALGLVRFLHSRGHLRPEWATVREPARERPEVRFFLERNPRYHEGEELCCITALESDNLRSYARRAFLEGMHDTTGIRLLCGDLGKRGALPQPAAAGAGDPVPAAADPAPA
jgi:hypothetical protein